MKHYLLILLVILLSACSLGMANTPSEKVKELLNKYKNQDSEIMKNLDEIVTSSYSGDYADRYKKLMVNQYKNMEYEITDEIIEGDSAIVTARITVFDYASALDRVNSYLSENQDEFMLNNQDENTESQNDQISSFDNDKFLDYKLNAFEQVNDKRDYNIQFTLSKTDDKWSIDSLSESDIEKIHGLSHE